jgi:hypothetical protein
MKKSQLKTLIREVIEEGRMKELLMKLNPEYDNFLKTLEELHLLGGPLGGDRGDKLSRLIFKAYEAGKEVQRDEDENLRVQSSEIDTSPRRIHLKNL